MLSDPFAIAAVAGSGGASAALDVRTRRLPNWLTLGIAALGLALASAHLVRLGIGSAIGGFAVGLLLMSPGHFIGKTGAGDVKLFAAIGTLLGPTLIVVAFVYTSIAGGLLAIAIAIRRGRLAETLEGTAALVRTGGANAADIERLSADNRFAYAPAIAAGALAAVLWR